jgi:hypothetical protein
LLSNERRVVRRLITGKWVLIVVFAAFSYAAALGVTEPPPPLAEAAKLLPNQLGDFQAEGPAKPYEGLVFGSAKFQDYSPVSAAQRVYQLTTVSGVTYRFIVYVVRAGSDSAAYSLETAHLNLRLKMDSSAPPEQRPNPPLAIQTNAIGTASLVGNTMFFGGVSFVKGSTYVSITGTGKDTYGLKEMESLARLLADPIDKGGGDIPVLIKHLPDWEKSYSQALYAVSAGSLKEVAGAQPVFAALNFDGGTEAVTANYGQSQLVIVEFTTPQFASDNDRRVGAKIQELKSQGQAVPTAYRRVGNYSVFVFDAPDEKTASALIDQVKYEQVVQWLGDDPHLYERVQKYVLQKTGGVVIAVLESSGLSVLLCVGVGGLFGALLFRRRRLARQRQGEAYSDAGGMVRLNLDEVVESDAARLLQGPGKHD